MKLRQQHPLTFADAMRHWNCDEATVRQWIIDGTLVPSYPIDGPVCPVYWLPKEQLAVPHFRGAGEDVSVHKFGLLYLVRPYWAPPLGCTFYYASEEREPPEQAHVGGEQQADGGIPSSARPQIVGYFMLDEQGGVAVGPPRPITLNEVIANGVVVREEVERIDALLAREARNGHEEESAAKSRVIVAALVALLLDNDGGKKKPVYHNQGYLVDALTAHLDGIRGFGKRSIDEILAEANRALAKRRKSG